MILGDERSSFYGNSRAETGWLVTPSIDVSYAFLPNVEGSFAAICDGQKHLFDVWVPNAIQGNLGDNEAPPFIEQHLHFGDDDAFDALPAIEFPGLDRANAFDEDDGWHYQIHYKCNTVNFGQASQSSDVSALNRILSKIYDTFSLSSVRDYIYNFLTDSSPETVALFFGVILSRHARYTSGFQNRKLNALRDLQLLDEKSAGDKTDNIRFVKDDKTGYFEVEDNTRHILPTNNHLSKRFFGIHKPALPHGTTTLKPPVSPQLYNKMVIMNSFYYIVVQPGLGKPAIYTSEAHPGKRFLYIYDQEEKDL